MIIRNKFSSSLAGLLLPLIAQLSNSAPSSPIYRPGPDDRLEFRDDLIEGDIVPNPQAKNGIRGEQYMWPNKTVPYQLDPGFNSTEVELILLAWAEIGEKTCITFRQSTAQDIDFVLVEKGEEGSRCFSFIGRRGQQQIMSFEPKCLKERGRIVHEMLHTLGFYHEQSRPDRDDYVTVVWDKIEEGKERQFNKYSEEEVDTMGAPYDYGSVLHYSAFRFSIDGSPTIIPKDPNAKIGQRIGISDIDAYKVNVMYDCTKFLQSSNKIA